MKKSAFTLITFFTAISFAHADDAKQTTTTNITADGKVIPVEQTQKSNTSTEKTEDIGNKTHSTKTTN